MPEIDPVVLRLVAEDGRYRASLNNVVRANERAEGSTIRLAASVDRAMGGIAGAVASVSFVALAQGFLAVADEAKKLDAQLRLATQGFGSFGKAQEDVRRIADATRSGLSETASLYGNFVRGAKELGASQEDAARATETFSKTLKISGADANQAASATLQFGQALASGALRGQIVRVNETATPGRVEGFRPSGSGHIIPLGRMNAVGGRSVIVNQTVHVDARNSVNPEGFAREILTLSGKQAQQAGASAYQMALRNAPSRMAQFQRDGT